MRTSLIALTLALAFAVGCGDGGGLDLEKCGNGSIDAGEKCDDGNLADTDACLSTCQPNVCGDGFVDKQHEECDGLDIACVNLDPTLQGNALCLASCALDRSGCRRVTGNPTPTATPTPDASGGVTPSSALPTSTPTPQPTPVGSVCTGTEQIVVTLSLDADVDSAALDLGYGPAVNLPGSGPDPAVEARVTFTGSGLTAVSDRDVSEDLVDDTLAVSLVGADVVPAGVFATVAFDCVGGQPIPTPASFACTVGSAALNGADPSPTCTVEIQ